MKRRSLAFILAGMVVVVVLASGSVNAQGDGATAAVGGGDAPGTGASLEGFVLIPPGTFMVGSPTTELLRETNETQHQVTLTHGIYVQTTEVTNQQYRDMAQWAYDNGYVTATSAGISDNLDGSTELLKTLGDGDYEITFSAGVFSRINPTRPVKYVTWYGSAAYCDWLSLQQGLPRAYNHSTWQCNAGNPYTAAGYRQPTEAEWEYVCRAGMQTPFNTGPCLDAGTEANYNGNYPYTECPSGPYVGETVPVGSYPANAFGLFDMHGNVWEWCNDWYGVYGGTVTDPVGPEAGSYRVVRGGVLNYPAAACRSAARHFYAPVDPGYIGIRPVRSAHECVPDVTDVADDQGGQLTVSWPRHDLDALAAPAPVTGYDVQRYNTGWQTLTTVTAAQADSYTVDVATSDILTLGQPEPYSRYRVVAMTGDPLVFFESLPDSGYSIDNIPPPAPVLTVEDDEAARSVFATGSRPSDYEETCFYKGPEPGFTPGDPIQCSTSRFYDEEHLRTYFYKARNFDIHGNPSEWSNEVTGQYPTDVPGAQITRLRIYSNQPNPFNPLTTIRFDLPTAGPVRLAIYDLAGRLVKVLVEGERAAGSHEAVWDGRDASGHSAPSGSYLARLVAGGKVEGVRLSLVR